MCCIMLYSPLTYSQILIPKLGLSLSTISVSKEASAGSDQKNGHGIVGGIGVEFMISHKIALQPELLFHQKSYKFISNESNTTYEDTETLNYLELPILVKIKFGSFYVNAGPSVALGLNGKYKSKSSGAYNASTERNIKFGKMPANYQGRDAFVDNNFDMGVQVGGGYIIAERVIIDLRYGFGLINISDKDPAMGYNDNKSKLRSFQVTIGVPIQLVRFKTVNN